MKKTKWLITYVLGGFYAISTLAQEHELKFTYDEAGNETSYYLSGTKSSSLVSEENLFALPEDILSEEELLAQKFKVSPNPTGGIAVLEWEADISENVTGIFMTSLINSETWPAILNDGNSVSVNLGSKPPGLYLVTFILKDSIVAEIQKKIIKY